MEFLLAPTVPSAPSPQNLQDVVPAGVVDGLVVRGRERLVTSSTIPIVKIFFSLFAKVATTSVITSYSIHYTKLYDKDSLEIPLGRRNDKKTEFLRGLRTFAVVAASIVFIVMAFKVNSLLRSDSNNSASMTSMYSTNSSSADSATADTSAGTTDTTAESADAYEITREAEMDEKSGSDLPSIEESLYGSTADGDATASYNFV